MYNANGALFGGNITLSRAGGATANISGNTSAAGAVNTYTIQNVTYSNQGKLYYKATAAGATTPTTNAGSSSATQASASSGAAFTALVAQQAVAGSTVVYVGSACCFVWGLDPAGNVRVAQGPIVQYTDTSANSTRCPLPALPDWFTPVQYQVIKLVSATAATWLFGTGLWNATGLVTDTPVDIIDLTAVDPLTA